MEKKLLFAIALICASFASSNGLPETSLNPRNNLRRNPKTFSLFSIVQFPNMECMAGSSSATTGTCLTASECTDKSGVADGDCAAGFGVCCVIATSTCPTSITHNITYVQNMNYPSGYLPTSTSTCSFTVNKVNDNICQLRLDFATMSGFATTSPAAATTCNDKLQVTGMSGFNPPEICGTSTGYHMYAEFGAKATDTITMKFIYGDITSTKMFNILLKQIPCDAEYRAPTDCVQYFTGLTGSIANYGHGSGDLLNNQEYTNCIRTEAGMCGISWCQATKASSGGSETFKLANPIALNTVKTEVCESTKGTVLTIPSMSLDGISTLPHYGSLAAVELDTTAKSAGSALASTSQGFVSTQCGGLFGAWGTLAAGRAHGASEVALTGTCLVSRVQPFTVGVLSAASSSPDYPAKNNGWKLDFTQVPC